MSPFLFNLYLDYCLNQVPILEKVIKNNQFFAFADDCQARTISITQAKEITKGFYELIPYGLEMNMSKSQILSGPPCLENLEELEGIPIVKKVKYLGYTLSTKRMLLFNDAKKNICKHMAVIKKKI